MYPFSGTIRNTSQISLRSNDASAHDRVPSRASARRPVSPYSQRSAANSSINIELLQATRRDDRHRDHPPPRRQYSLSAPQINIPGRSDSPSPTIEVKAPVEDSPTSIKDVSSPLQGGLYFPSPDSLVDQGNGSDIDNQSTLQLSRRASCSTYINQTRNENSNTLTPGIIGIATGSPKTSIAESHKTSVACLSVTPVVPSETKRYESRTKIRKEGTNIAIAPLTLDYAKPGPPQGWIRHAHPEGARYFYNEKKRVYTDAEIYDPKVLHLLEKSLREIEAYKTESFPKFGAIVLNLNRQEDGSYKPQYYCVDHDSKLIFFLEEFQAKWLEAWSEVQGITSRYHLGYEMSAQYWYFVQLYPHSLQLSKEMVNDLRDIVVHLIGDSMTSPYSTASYTLDNLYKILTLTGELENNIGPKSVGAMGVLARKMYIFNHARFLNVHGESSARIERNFSVYANELYQRTWLIGSLSLILFSAPDVHLVNLQKMWVDKMMHKSVWQESMQRMYDEWQEFVFFATVVLNANVAFLAIQSVDSNHSPNGRSAAQIASYISVIANIASIILGLLLMRQNRTKSRETADDVQKFLLKREHRLSGLESLAILFSLPYALLMWGMVSFLAAFCFMCYDGSNIITRSFVGMFGLAMAILVAWCTYLSWEGRTKEEQNLRWYAYTDHEKDFDGPNEASSQNPEPENLQLEVDEPAPTSFRWRFPAVFGTSRGSGRSRTRKDAADMA